MQTSRTQKSKRGTNKNLEKGTENKWKKHRNNESDYPLTQNKFDILMETEITNLIVNAENNFIIEGSERSDETESSEEADQYSQDMERLRKLHNSRNESTVNNNEQSNDPTESNQSAQKPENRNITRLNVT